MSGYQRRPLHTYPTEFFTLARLGGGLGREGLTVTYPQKKDAYRTRTVWYHFVAALVREKKKDLVYGAKQISVAVRENPETGHWEVTFYTQRDWEIAIPIREALTGLGVEVREDDREEPDRDLG